MNRFKKSRVRLQPAHYMILLFTGVIAVGTMLLILPVSHIKPISFLDALFTATSAICVTGLLTINVAETFTTFGQVVILCLIQLGGLGIMTASTIFMLLLGKSVSMRESSIVHSAFMATHQINIRSLIVAVFALMLFFETLGAIAFTLIWAGEMGLKEAAYAGLFHSVSAFCNAGISTFSDGFIGMEKNWLADTVCIILIVAGAFGFMAITEYYGWIVNRGKVKRNWSLQTRVIALYTLTLIMVGWVGFIGFEINNTLAGKPLPEQLLSALFHSVSGRTAGFSNIDPALFNNTTLYLFIILMFIGGAPGSVAGGIKITTFAVLIGMAISRYKGHERVNIFNHAVPEQIVSRSIAVIFISIIVLAAFMTLLLITESVSGVDPAQTRGAFLQIGFEAMSAFGTVGASMGITSSLTSAGKVLIVLLMLIGRLGPLTVVMAVSTKEKRATYQLSEEAVMVG